MQRTKNKPFKKADAILTADWHLREDTPVCRTDDFMEAMKTKLHHIQLLQRKHDCPVIHAGDLFDFWKASPSLLTFAIENLPNRFYTIYGNHDLPQHNYEMRHKSGVHTLERAGALTVLNHVHWGMEPQENIQYVTGLNILVWHCMTWQGVLPYPGCTDLRAAAILRQYPKYDLILTGHNHKAFVEEHKGRLLVNPGSIFRSTASQEDFKPRVYLYYAATNTVEPYYLPIEEGVISRQHIEQKEQRDSRIEAFINTLDTDWEVEMSFEQNVEIFCKRNKVEKPVLEILDKVME